MHLDSMNAGHFWGSDILVRWLWWAVAGDPHLVNKTTSSRTILTRFQAVFTRAARQWDSLAEGPANRSSRHWRQSQLQAHDH